MCMITQLKTAQQNKHVLLCGIFPKLFHSNSWLKKVQTLIKNKKLCKMYSKYKTVGSFENLSNVYFTLIWTKWTNV